MTDNPNIFIMPVGLQAVMLPQEEVDAIPDDQIQPMHKVLIEAGYWTKAECVAYNVFVQINAEAIRNQEYFLQMYREEVQRRDSKTSSLIIPDRKIFVP